MLNFGGVWQKVKNHQQIQAQGPLSVGSDVCDRGVIGTLFFHSRPFDRMNKWKVSRYLM